MRMTYEEASKYEEYALTPEELIRKTKKIVDALTPEERAEIQITHGFRRVQSKYSGSIIEHGELDPMTVGEYYDRCLQDLEKKYEKYNTINWVCKPSEVQSGYQLNVDKLTPQEKSIDFFYYLSEHGFGLGSYDYYPYEVLKMCWWSLIQSRKSPKERAKDKEVKRIIEEDKKYILPGEKDVGYATIAQRKAKANPPQTSLSDDEIASFDRMSERWLSRWCNFSGNWMWVVPCLLLCIVANKGLSAAIGLLIFMGAGEWYSWKVKEYCSVILPWYKQAGIMMERRVFNKL